MNIEKMREGFEAAYRDACLSRPIPRFDPEVFVKDHCDDYLNPLVQSAWWAWQASRAAIEVELPGSFWQDYVNKNEVMDADRVIEAIESIGLKVAP